MARATLIAVLACALAGCWEEIHYSPPPEAQPGDDIGAAAGDESTQFADEVADAIIDGTVSAVEQSTTEPPSDTSEAIETGQAVESEPPAATEPPIETEPRYRMEETVVATSSETPTQPVAVAKEPPAAGGNAQPSADTPQAQTAQAPAAHAMDPSHSTRRVAWSLGSNLSLAALANDRGAPADRVTLWFDTARRQAKLFGIELTDLPPRPAADAIDPQSKPAMDYLFAEGQTIGRQLGTQFGDDCAALFELALKSNLLLVRYEPGIPIVKSLSAAVTPAAERAQLPPEFYAPLLKLLDEGAPATAVRDAVFQLHDNVDQYLSTGTSAAKP